MSSCSLSTLQPPEVSSCSLSTLQPPEVSSLILLQCCPPQPRGNHIDDKDSITFAAKLSRLSLNGFLICGCESVVHNDFWRWPDWCHMIYDWISPSWLLKCCPPYLQELTDWPIPAQHHLTYFAMFCLLRWKFGLLIHKDMPFWNWCSMY